MICLLVRRRGRGVESGVVYVDGGTVTEANPVVLRDRQKLAQDGVVTCTVIISKRRGSVEAVEVSSRGVATSTDDLLLGEAQELVRAHVTKLTGSGSVFALTARPRTEDAPMRRRA